MFVHAGCVVHVCTCRLCGTCVYVQAVWYMCVRAGMCECVTVLVIFLAGEFGSERLVQQVVDQILAATARKENMEQVTHSTPQGTMSGTQATPTTTPTVQQQGMNMAVCKMIDYRKMPRPFFNGLGNKGMQLYTQIHIMHTCTHTRAHTHTHTLSQTPPTLTFLPPNSSSRVRRRKHYTKKN